MCQYEQISRDLVVAKMLPPDVDELINLEQSIPSPVAPVSTIIYINRLYHQQWRFLDDPGIELGGKSLNFVNFTMKNAKFPLFSI